VTNGPASDEYGPTWDIEPHTLAKHKLLRTYWEKWLPILSKKNKHLNYVDGFAGPGYYTGGEDGSPVVILKASRDHKLKPRAAVTFGFIEVDKVRAKLLRDKLVKEFPPGNLPAKYVHFVEEGKFEDVLGAAIKKIQAGGGRLAPTFAFLDPFGYSGMPMASIRELLQFPSCEVLVTFMVGFEKRFLDPTHATANDQLFGCDEWKGAIPLAGQARVDFLVDLYRRKLHDFGGATYVRSFEICNSAGQTLYHLVFGTTHSEGMVQFKEAMFHVDKRGTETFSDQTDPHMHTLLDYMDKADAPWIADAANLTYQEFAGKSPSVREVREWVWIHSPYVWRKPIFDRLVSDGRMKHQRAKRRGAGYNDSERLDFTPQSSPVA
jgi:three-Cys-motif partner protein